MVTLDRLKENKLHRRMSVLPGPGVVLDIVKDNDIVCDQDHLPDALRDRFPPEKFFECVRQLNSLFLYANRTRHTFLFTIPLFYFIAAIILGFLFRHALHISLTIIIVACIVSLILCHSSLRKQSEELHQHLQTLLAKWNTTVAPYNALWQMQSTRRKNRHLQISITLHLACTLPALEEPLPAYTSQPNMNDIPLIPATAPPISEFHYAPPDGFDGPPIQVYDA